VVENTCDEGQGRAVPTTYFHLDLAAQNEQSLMNPQALSKLEDIPPEKLFFLETGERKKERKFTSGWGVATSNTAE